MTQQPRDDSGKFGTKPHNPDAPRRVVSLKVSVNELTAIDQAAKAAGQTRKGWVRSLIRSSLKLTALAALLAAGPATAETLPSFKPACRSDALSQAECNSGSEQDRILNKPACRSDALSQAECNSGSEQDRILKEIDRRQKTEEAADQRAEQQKETALRARMKQFGDCFYDWKGWKKTAADVRVTGYACGHSLIPEQKVAVNCAKLKVSRYRKKGEVITRKEAVEIQRQGRYVDPYMVEGSGGKWEWTDWEWPTDGQKNMVAALCSNI